jgi:hypothetical protein
MVSSFKGNGVCLEEFKLSTSPIGINSKGMVVGSSNPKVIKASRNSSMLGNTKAK